MPGVFDPLLILNLHLRLWGSYIVDWMSGRQFAAEGRRDTAVTHLASARRQNKGNGTPGPTKDKKRVMDMTLFSKRIKRRKQ